MRVITSADFKPFDWDAVSTSYRGRLPHLTQAGAIYFVTFRLADSIPLEVARRWNADKTTWLAKNPAPWTTELEREYHRRFTMRLERWLDAGRGACVLRDTALRNEVAASLHHDDGKLYELGDWVVMPNHVHVLLRPLVVVPISKLLGPVKGSSARRINESLGFSGSLWMDESFDHIVRGMDSLRKFQRYIAQNPVKAGLTPETFSYEQRWLLK
ncbi:MAG: transposase [Verrucomicrobiaceae bacterium]